MIPKIKDLSEIDPFNTFHAVSIGNDLYIPGGSILPIKKDSVFLQRKDYSTLENVAGFLDNTLLKVNCPNLDPKHCISKGTYVFSFDYSIRTVSTFTGRGGTVTTADINNLRRRVNMGTLSTAVALVVFIGDQFFLLPMKCFTIKYYVHVELRELTDQKVYKNYVKRYLVNRKEKNFLLANVINHSNGELKKKFFGEAIPVKVVLLGVYIKNVLSETKEPIEKRILSTLDRFITWKSVIPHNNKMKRILRIIVYRNNYGLSYYKLDNHKQLVLDESLYSHLSPSRRVSEILIKDQFVEVSDNREAKIPLGSIPILAKESYIEKLCNFDKICKFSKKTLKVN